MKKILLSLLLITPTCYAGTISHSDYTSNTTITASGQNANENRIYNEFNGNIDNTNIKAGGITSSNIAAGTIATDRLNSVLQSSITAMVTTNSDAVINSTYTHIGPIIISSGVKANGSYGTAGQVLTSSGTASGSPIWSSVSSVGGYVFLASATANGSGGVSFTLSTGSYSTYMIMMDSVTGTTNGTTLEAQINDSTGFLAANYHYVTHIDYSGNNSGISSNSAAIWVLNNTGDLNNASGQGLSGVLTVYGVLSNAPSHMATWQTANNSNAQGLEQGVGTGFVTTAKSPITGVQFVTAAGNIATGNFYVYGLRTN